MANEKVTSIDFNALFDGKVPSDSLETLTRLTNISPKDNSAEVAAAKAKVETLRTELKAAREAVKAARKSGGLSASDAEFVKAARKHENPIIAGIAKSISLPRGSHA